MARREPQQRRDRTESRGAGGQRNKQHTAPRPRESRAGNQKKPETTGARSEKEKKRSTKRQRERQGDTKGGGGGNNHNRAAHGQRGTTKKARAHREPRRGRPTKQTGHSAKAQGTRGRKPDKGRDNGGARRREKKTQAGGGGQKKNRAPRPKATWAGNQRKKETRGARVKQNSRTIKKKKKGGGGGRQPKNHKRGNPSLEGAEQSRKTKGPEEQERRTKTRPGGRPARPSQEGRAHAHTHGTRAWRPPTRKGR